MATVQEIRELFKKIDLRFQTVQNSVLPVFLNSIDQNIVKLIITKYLSGRSGKLRTRTGNLKSSIRADAKVVDKEQLRGTIEAGGPAAEYAQIQEEGGTIRASGGGWLTVPLEVNKDARKILFTLAGNNKGGWTSARDFDNTFLQLSKKGNLIIFQNKGKKIIPLFILQSQVQIKPKYYLRDGIKAGSGKVFDDVMKQVVSEIMVGTF